MMCLPSERFRKKMQMVKPWLIFDKEKGELVLRDDAPKEVKDAYEYCQKNYPDPDY